MVPEHPQELRQRLCQSCPGLARDLLQARRDTKLLTRFFLFALKTALERGCEKPCAGFNRFLP